MLMGLRNHRWLWMVPLLLFLCFVAARHLDYNLIWLDERLSVQFSGVLDDKTLADVPNDLMYTEWERHPPLYYMLLHVWFDVFGISEYSGRLFSLLAGLIAVAGLYRLGRDISGSGWVAYGGVIVMGLSALYVHHLHEMRMYPLVMLATIAALWAYWDVMVGQRGGFASVLLLIGGLFIACMSYYLSIFFAITLGLYHLAFGWRLAKGYPERWRRAFVALAATAVMLLPWYVSWFVHVQTSAPVILFAEEGMSGLHIIGQTIFFFGNDFPALFLILLVLAFVTVPKSAAFVWIFVCGFGSYGLLFVASQLITEAEVYSVRNFMIAWPMIALVIGYSLHAQGRIPFLRAMLLVALLYLGGRIALDMDRFIEMGNPPVHTLTPVEQALAVCTQPQETIYIEQTLLTPYWRELFSYYHTGAGFQYELITINSDINVDAMMPYWVVYRDEAIAQRISPENAGYTLCDQQNTPQARIAHYAPLCPAACDALR